MAIHNPARIPVVAEIRRQELLALARVERRHRTVERRPGRRVDRRSIRAWGLAFVANL